MPAYAPLQNVRFSTVQLGDIQKSIYNDVGYIMCFDKKHGIQARQRSPLQTKGAALSGGLPRRHLRHMGTTTSAIGAVRTLRLPISWLSHTWFYSERQNCIEVSSPGLDNQKGKRFGLLFGVPRLSGSASRTRVLVSVSLCPCEGWVWARSYLPLSSVHRGRSRFIAQASHATPQAEAKG